MGKRPACPHCGSFNIAHWLASSYQCKNPECKQVFHVHTAVNKEYIPAHPRIKATRTVSEKQERLNAIAYKGRVTPNSGATGGQKSDVYAVDLRMECKTTEKGSFSLRKKDLELNESHAADAEIPAFAIEFRGATSLKTRQYIVISDAWFRELLELHRDKNTRRS